MKNKIIGFLVFSLLLIFTTQTQAYYLQIGSHGNDVVFLRQSLVEKGYLKVKTPDGNFDNSTKLAVIAFQRDNKLRADGIVGPKTLAVLNGSQNILQKQNLFKPVTSVLTSATNSIILPTSTIKKDTYTAKCVASKCVNIISPKNGEVFNAGQSIHVNWKSIGFNNFREVSISLVKKTGSSYLNIYDFELNATDRGTTNIVLPSDLKFGLNYAIKISVHNVNEPDVSSYSNGTFTIKALNKLVCLKPTILISQDPLVTPGGDVIASYDISAGGGDCTVIVKSIKFKSNTAVMTNWHTQIADVIFSQNGNTFTLTFPNDLQLSGVLVDSPNGLHASAQVIDILRGNVNPVSQGTSIIIPVSIDAVNINGEPIIDVSGLN